MRLATWMFVVIIVTTLFMAYDSMSAEDDFIVITEDNKIVRCFTDYQGNLICV